MREHGLTCIGSKKPKIEIEGVYRLRDSGRENREREGEREKKQAVLRQDRTGDQKLNARIGKGFACVCVTASVSLVDASWRNPW